MKMGSDALRIVKFFVLNGVNDKPARSEVINMKTSTGYYGCMKCQQIGLRIETKKNGHVIVWPYDQLRPRRTIENYNVDVSRSTKANNIQFLKSHGIKGLSVLNELSFYHPIMNTNIDYMHSILEGVTKRFFFVWFEEVDTSGLLKLHIDKINDRLLNLRPPSYIPSKPRSIKLWRLWRAHEFLSFLLYYSLPVFF